MDDRILEVKKNLPSEVFIDVGINGRNTWNKVMMNLNETSYTKTGKMARKDCYEEAFGKTSQYAISDLFWAVFTREYISAYFNENLDTFSGGWKYTLVAHSENYTGDHHA